MMRSATLPLLSSDSQPVVERDRGWSRLGMLRPEKVCQAGPPSHAVPVVPSGSPVERPERIGIAPPVEPRAALPSSRAAVVVEPESAANTQVLVHPAAKPVGT